MTAAPLGPADVVGMLRAAGVPYEVICVEPVVTMTAPDRDGWLSLVPRLDEDDAPAASGCLLLDGPTEPPGHRRDPAAV